MAKVNKNKLTAAQLARNKVIKTKLAKLGVNDETLTELAMLAEYNPDQYCLANDDKPIVAVSPLLLRASKRRKKLESVLKHLEIYNILLIRKYPDKYSFVGKSSFGLLLSHDIDREKGLSIKMACGMAIIEFEQQIKLADMKDFLANQGAVSLIPSPNQKTPGEFYSQVNMPTVPVSNAVIDTGQHEINAGLEDLKERLKSLDPNTPDMSNAILEHLNAWETDKSMLMFPDTEPLFIDYSDVVSTVPYAPSVAEQQPPLTDMLMDESLKKLSAQTNPLSINPELFEKIKSIDPFDIDLNNHDSMSDAETAIAASLNILNPKGV